MSLLQRIKQDQLQARKNREITRANLLTTLIGEAEMIGKNNGNRETTDEEVVATIRKFLKNNLETQKVANLPTSMTLQNEQSILEQYLPQQLDKIGLKSILTARLDMGFKTKGDLMKALKESHPGQYDGRMASEVIDELLKAN